MLTAFIAWLAFIAGFCACALFMGRTRDDDHETETDVPRDDAVQRLIDRNRSAR